MRGRRVFAPSPWLSLLAVAGCVTFVLLGRWQLGRAEEKRALHASFASGAGPAVPLPGAFGTVPRYQRVRVTGRYDGAHQFLLDNMSDAGQPGYHVLTPLRLANDRVVIVDRGFLPFGTMRRNQLPPIAVDGTERTVVGRADSLPRPAVELQAQPGSGWPRVVSFPRTGELAAALGTEVHPQVVLLDAAEPDGFRRNWQAPGPAPERHTGYAVQWFAFAVTLAVIWLLLSLRPRQEAE